MPKPEKKIIPLLHKSIHRLKDSPIPKTVDFIPSLDLGTLTTRLWLPSIFLNFLLSKNF